MFGPDFQVSDLLEKAAPEIAETGRTFEDNAKIKAMTVSQLFPNEVVIADDSGIEVEALNDAPGVLSARYAGEKATDEENVQKLLRELRDKSVAGNGSLSKARFVCVIALARGAKIIRAFRGEVAGDIVPEPRGKNGFGYDPVFQPVGYDKTLAELAREVKHRISHRAHAAEKLRVFLSQNPFKGTNDS